MKQLRVIRGLAPAPAAYLIAAVCLLLLCAGPLARTARAQAKLHIEFDPPSVDLEPGKKVTVRAVVKDENGVQASNVAVEWRVVEKGNEDYVTLGQTVNEPAKNEVTIFGLSAAPSAKAPGLVPVIASTANAPPNVLVVKYKAKESALVELAYDNPDPKNAPPTVGPGGKTLLRVKVTEKDRDDPKKVKDLPDAAVTWEIPDNVKDFAALGPVSKDKPREVTLYGLSSDKAPRPAIIPVVAKFGGASLLVDVPYTASLEPVVPVQVIWDVLPQDIVSDNFGRSIKKEFYGIEVTIRNNSGADLQVSGLAFDLNKDGRTLVPVTSYPIVQGVLAKRKLTHPRTLTISSLGYFGQLLTGLNPFFHNANHAKNYSVGIDIVSNPLAKGVEAVWKDPVPDEVNRLEQQALRDDKIVANGQILKTRVFFPKDALYEHGHGDRDKVKSVRDKLGNLILVGYKIVRSGYITSSQPATPQQ